MNILAIDTATNVLSVALSVGRSEEAPNTRWHIEADAGLRHSEILMDMVDTLLKQGGLEPADINLVSCMKGPGSFTGLRIGFSVAKGIALALKIPLIPIPTLDCMAYSYSVWPGIVIPAIDAKKGRFFSALYRGGIRITDEKDADLAALAGLISDALASSPDGEKSILLTGPDAAMLHTELQKQLSGCPDAESPPGLRPDFIRLDPAYRKGRAVELLELAKKGAETDIGEDNFFAGPEYLRKSDAELNI